MTFGEVNYMNVKLVKFLNAFLVLMLMLCTLSLVAVATEETTAPIAQFGTQAPSQADTQPVTEQPTEPITEPVTEPVTEAQTQAVTTGESGTFATSPATEQQTAATESVSYVIDAPDEPIANDYTYQNNYENENIQQTSIVYDEDETKATRSRPTNAEKEEIKVTDTNKYTRLFTIVGWVSGIVAVLCIAALIAVNRMYYLQKHPKKQNRKRR